MGCQIFGMKDPPKADRTRGRMPGPPPKRVKAFSGFERKAELHLDQLDAATTLQDLDLPGNRLEALKGDRKGQYSISIIDQQRLCFEWPKTGRGPSNVEIVDYHQELSHGTQRNTSG